MYFFCLQADRPLTGGLISGGGGTFIQGGGACNRLYVFLFTGRWAYNWWGRVISGGGALISGGACNRMYFLFTNRWGACKWRGRGGLYPRGL